VPQARRRRGVHGDWAGERAWRNYIGQLLKPERRKLINSVRNGARLGDGTSDCCDWACMRGAVTLSRQDFASANKPFDRTFVGGVPHDASTFFDLPLVNSFIQYK
jgi:hypothetical protein